MKYKIQIQISVSVTDFHDCFLAHILKSALCNKYILIIFHKTIEVIVQLLSSMHS